jgi:hypothetical protein
VPALKAKGIFWREDRKCPPSAKVGLVRTMGALVARSQDGSVADATGLAGIYDFTQIQS